VNLEAKAESMSGTVLIVPCFNEAQRLRTDDFLEFARRWADGRFLFVNDGSSDGTAEVLAQLCARLPTSLETISLPENRGKAEAVRQGALHALASNPAAVGFWDADLATPLRAIPRFQQVLADRAQVDVVMGARVRLMGRQIERSPMRHYLGRVFATAVTLALRTPVYDTQCGAKLFRNSPPIREAFAQPFLSRWIFDVELFSRYLDARRHAGQDGRAGIYELPLDEWTDVGGSKVRPHHFLQAAIDLGRIVAASKLSRHQLGPSGGSGVSSE
jgi:dolichyl-phosphate beta-glucosyltransferase